MAIATDQQVQNYVDQRVRVRCEQLRALRLAVEDDAAAIDDIYAALTQETPTWSDTRADAPPHLLLPSDVLAWNTFITRLREFFAGTLTDGNKNEAAAQYPIILDGCVRSVELQP